MKCIAAFASIRVVALLLLLFAFAKCLLEGDPGLLVHDTNKKILARWVSRDNNQPKKNQKMKITDGPRLAYLIIPFACLKSTAVNTPINLILSFDPSHKTSWSNHQNVQGNRKTNRGRLGTWSTMDQRTSRRWRKWKLWTSHREGIQANCRNMVVQGIHQLQPKDHRCFLLHLLCCRRTSHHIRICVCQIDQQLHWSRRDAYRHCMVRCVLRHLWRATYGK